MMAAALLGDLPAAMAIGWLGMYMHWSLWSSLGLSLFIYSGALQAALLGLMILNPPLAVVLGMAFALNLRPMLYGPHLEAARPGWPRWYRVVLSFFLTDELYAAGLSRIDTSRGSPSCSPSGGSGEQSLVRWEPGLSPFPGWHSFLSPCPPSLLPSWSRASRNRRTSRPWRRLWYWRDWAAWKRGPPDTR